MNIDDFLQQESFKCLDEHLTKEMYNSAGKNLVSRIIEVLEVTEVEARDWFYSSRIALGGKRPYDLCKEGNSREVEKILSRIEHGVYS